MRIAIFEQIFFIMRPEELKIHKKLVYCNICEHRNELEDSYPTCKLTGRFAEFESDCVNFRIDTDEFLRLKIAIKEDIIRTDNIERLSTDYYNDDSWVNYDFVKYEYPIHNIRLPDEIVIKQPFIRNIFLSSFFFIIFFSVSFGNLTKSSLNQVSGFLISIIIGFIPGYIAFRQFSKNISEIILNKRGIETKGQESVKFEWKEILSFRIKNVYRKTKGGNEPSKFFKIYFVSGYSEVLSTENFLTDRKSEDLIEWMYKYNHVYWSQFMPEDKLMPNSYHKGQNERTPYSLFKISTGNSLYQKQITFLRKALPYSIDWHDVNWKTYHEKSFHFVAHINDSVIGCTVLMPDAQEKHIAHILHLIVERKWRRKGVGKALIKELTEYAKLKRIKEIYCNSLVENLSYFTSMNFKKVDETYDDGGIHRYTMKFDIS